MQIHSRSCTVGAIIGLGLMIALGFTAIHPPAVQGHALLVRSIPAADAELTTSPSTIDLWFSETLEPRFSSVRVVDAAGNQVPTAPASVDAADLSHIMVSLSPLEPGVYTIVWRTLSRDDGHEWVGSFPITVLYPDGSRPLDSAGSTAEPQQSELPTPLETLARWISLMGVILFVGAFSFSVVMAGAFYTPQLQNATPEPRQLLAAQTAAATTSALVLATLALLSGGWLQLAAQAIAVGEPGSILELSVATRPGKLILLRELWAGIALFLVLWSSSNSMSCWRRWLLGSAGVYAGAIVVLSVAALVHPLLVLATIVLSVGLQIATSTGRLSDHRIGPWPVLIFWNLLVVSLAILSTFSLGSHAAAAPGSAWAIIGDVLHLAAAAIWLGGLLILAFVLWRARSQLSGLKPTLLRQGLRRFSYLAGGAVLVLAVTGLFSSLVEIPAVEMLWTTLYGRLLLGKLLLVLLALGIALFNNRWIHATRTESETKSTLMRFVHQTMAESWAGIALMAVVAMLVQTPAPLATEQIRPADNIVNHIVQADDLQVHIQIAPNQVGHNRFVVHLYHTDNSSIGEVQLVRLFFVHQEVDLGQAEVDLEPVGADIFEIEGAHFGQPGLWQTRVYVRRRGMDDALATIDVLVPPADSRTRGQPWQNPIPTLSGYVLIGGFLLSVAVLAIIGCRYRRVRPT